MYYSDHIFRSHVPGEGDISAGDEKMQTDASLHLHYMDVVKKTLRKENIIFQELEECVLRVSWTNKQIVIAAQEGTACLQMAGRAHIGMPAEKRPAAYELINSLNEDELVQCYLDEKGNLTACQILVLADSVLSEKMVITMLGYVWNALDAGFEPLMKLRYS